MDVYLYMKRYGPIDLGIIILVPPTQKLNDIFASCYGFDIKFLVYRLHTTTSKQTHVHLVYIYFMSIMYPAAIYI